MADLYSLVHREAGPLATFTTQNEAEEERLAVLQDEPSWVVDLWIEPAAMKMRLAGMRYRTLLS